MDPRKFICVWKFPSKIVIGKPFFFFIIIAFSQRGWSNVTASFTLYFLHWSETNINVVKAVDILFGSKSMNRRNSTWCNPSTCIFIRIWRMKPDHSETLLRRLSVDIKRIHMDAMFSFPVMMLKLFISFSTSEISDLSILTVYLIGMANFRRSSLAGYFFKIGFCCTQLCLTTLRIMLIIWRVFLPSRVAWRISALSAKQRGRPNNSMKSTMLGEEWWKHKDFSSSRTFSMLGPKPIVCSSCTTNSEPPLLLCISAANARSKGQSMVFGLASLIRAWPIAAIFTSFGFDRGEGEGKVNGWKTALFQAQRKALLNCSDREMKKDVSLISKILDIWSDQVCSQFDYSCLLVIILF